MQLSGRHSKPEVKGRLPLRECVTQGFPVLSAGPTPYTPNER
jgi:hypothetical protein